MAYSTALSQAIAILLFINYKMEEFRYEFVSTKAISEHLSIPAPTTVKVLKSLNAAGITDTKEGAKGGILLVKPLKEITMLDIFLAVEQGKPLFKIQTDFLVSGQEIDDMREKMVVSLQNVENAMKDSLKKVTLEELRN